MRYILPFILLATATVDAKELFRGPSIGIPGAHARRMENPLYREYQGRLTERHVYAQRKKIELAQSRPPAKRGQHGSCEF